MSQALPYFYFFLICAVNAGKDVGSEVFMKWENSYSPQLVVFYMSLAPVLFLTLTNLFRGTFRKELSLVTSKKGALKDSIILGVSTLVSFYAIFAAFATSLGSALANFIDFGTFPIFTGILAIFILNEKSHLRAFVIASALGTIGITLFLLPRTEMPDHIGGGVWFGLALALLGGFASGFWANYIKRVSDHGISREMVVWVRMFIPTLVLGAITLATGELRFETGQGFLFILGLVGTIPKVLSVNVIEKLNVRSFALLSYMVPILTAVFAVWWTPTELFGLDILAAALILGGIVYFERAQAKDRSIS